MAKERNFPIDLVLVRHGESEGNLCQFFSKKGDDRLWSTPNFKDRHNSKYRLTEKGREQAAAAGKYIRANISEHFDRYYCSEFIRAQETAGLLQMPNANWNVESYLRERDTGVLVGRSHIQRQTHYKDETRFAASDSYYWAPPGGESIANACLRIDRFLDSLRENSAGLRVLAVCHGNMMKGFRVRLERLTQAMFTEWEAESKINPKAKIHNCQILHYTRRNPNSGGIHGSFRWVRSICPYDEEKGSREWREIIRPTFSNEALLAFAKSVPQLISTADAERLKKIDAEAAPEKAQRIEEADRMKALISDHPLHQGVGACEPTGIPFKSLERKGFSSFDSSLSAAASSSNDSTTTASNRQTTTQSKSDTVQGDDME